MPSSPLARSTAWAPFCQAIDDLTSWAKRNRYALASDGDTCDPRLAAEADALGELFAILEDGEADIIPLSELLRLRGFPYSERMALALCAGRVLDIGAGTGVHSLWLQRNGIDVTALDAQERLVAVQRESGVADVRCGDVMQEGWRRGPGERWDTLLLMMNGFGVCGDLNRLEQLLEICRGLLHPGGVILADGCDLRTSPAPEEARRIDLREEQGRGFGEAILSVGYRPASGSLVKGESFPWLYLDYESLVLVAAQTGWQCQRVFDSGPDYLARLVMS